MPFEHVNNTYTDFAKMIGPYKILRACKRSWAPDCIILIGITFISCICVLFPISALLKWQKCCCFSRTVSAFTCNDVADSGDSGDIVTDPGSPGYCQWQAACLTKAYQCSSILFAPGMSWRLGLKQKLSNLYFLTLICFIFMLSTKYRR